MDVAGAVDDPNKTIGAGNIARLKSASTFKLPEGECSVNAATGDFPLTLVADGAGRRYNGLITGKGSVRIEGAPDHRPVEISGTHTNSYQGATTLARGVLKLNKPDNVTAIPGISRWAGRRRRTKATA